jgi:tetratricopeptide (TPR) repeat protein
MRRPDSTRIDLDVALEVARREGYPAVIAGGVTRVGAGYQLSVQIVEASSGEVAVRLRETAESDTDVLGAVERLAHLTRRHLGESLASVRRSQPLPMLTTPSLEALQFHARASVHGLNGELSDAIALATQAIAEDSAFAAAHRALSLWYGQMGDPVSANRHIELAYRFNERLLPRERFLVSATYNRSRGRLDSAASYYDLLLDGNPDDITALNNLGDIYERMGRYEETLALYRRALEIGGSAANYVNLASVARTLNMHELADSVFIAMRERYPNIFPTWQTQAMNAYLADDVTVLEQVAVDMVNHRPLPFPNIYGRWLHSLLGARRGRISGALALVDSVTTLSKGVSTPFLYYPLLTAEYAALAAGAPEAVLPTLEAVAPFDELGSAPAFEYEAMGILANGYVLAGDPGAAERLLVRMDSLADAVGIVPPAIGAQVRAALALNANRPEESLEWLQESRGAGFGLLRHAGRLLLADTYSVLGRYDIAAAHYDSLTSTYRLNYQDVWTFAPILPLAHERAARAYLALGDTASAVSHLASFIDLWQDAEPSFQPLVTDATRHLAQLVGESPAPGR